MATSFYEEIVAITEQAIEQKTCSMKRKTVYNAIMARALAGNWDITFSTCDYPDSIRWRYGWDTLKDILINELCNGAGFSFVEECFSEVIHEKVITITWKSGGF